MFRASNRERFTIRSTPDTAAQMINHLRDLYDNVGVWIPTPDLTRKLLYFNLHNVLPRHHDQA